MYIVRIKQTIILSSEKRKKELRSKANDISSPPTHVYDKVLTMKRNYHSKCSTL